MKVKMYRLLTEPQPDAFDYFYFEKGLETWRAEEAKPEERENKTYGAGPVRRVVAPRY